jgi:hypothetical protein
VHKLLTGLFIFFTAIATSSAQSLSSTVIASGGISYTSTEGYNLSSTFGELAVKTYSFAGNYYITEGFQQGTFRKSAPVTDDKLVKVGPNPLTYKANYLLRITLPVKDEINSYVVTVFSMDGRCLYSEKISDMSSGVTIRVDFTTYSRGLYFIKIQSTNGQYLKTFKIEKI